MRNIVTTLLIIGALALAVAGAAIEDDKVMAKPCAYVLASSPEENTNAYASKFSASRTVDLTLSVLLPTTSTGEHRLALRVYTPNGSLYQELAVPVASPGTAKAHGLQTRTLPGYPRAKKVVIPQEVSYLNQRFYRVDVPFPVGGTLITSNGLYGKWRITAHLDGADDACGAAAQIVITE